MSKKERKNVKKVILWVFVALAIVMLVGFVQSLSTSLIPEKFDAPVPKIG